VSFLPFAFTGGWKNQVTGFRANYEEFKKLNVEILQISADTIPSLKVWAEQLGGIPFPLLSDYWPHGAIGKAYGVFNDERGMDKRSAFVLDSQGVIRYAKVYEPGTIPESKELLEQLRRIWSPTSNKKAVDGSRELSTASAAARGRAGAATVPPCGGSGSFSSRCDQRILPRRGLIPIFAVRRGIVAYASHAVTYRAWQVAAVVRDRRSRTTHELQLRRPHTRSLVFRFVPACFCKGLAYIGCGAVCVFPLRVK
jgi:peroxiredoxin